MHTPSHLVLIQQNMLPVFVLPGFQWEIFRVDSIDNSPQRLPAPW